MKACPTHFGISVVLPAYLLRILAVEVDRNFMELSVVVEVHLGVKLSNFLIILIGNKCFDFL